MVTAPCTADNRTNINNVTSSNIVTITLTRICRQWITKCIGEEEEFL